MRLVYENMEYHLTKKVAKTEYQELAVSAPDGWDAPPNIYKASISDDEKIVHLYPGGEVERKLLPDIVRLLSEVEKADTNRHNYSVHIPEGYVQFDSHKEYDKGVAMFPLTTPDEHNLFIRSTAYADNIHQSIVSLTAVRVVDTYHLLVGAEHVISFGSWELEAIRTLLSSLS
jgi:hypothetical protein